MNHFNRRKFLQTSSTLLAASFIGPSFINANKRKIPLLSFSTLGCPDWTFQQIADFASVNSYDGIELRGIQHELDLTKCDAFSTAENITATMTIMKEKKLQFVDLGSSSTLHFPEGAERQKNLDEGKRFIDLAGQIQCPYIRVFPNKIPKDQGKEETMDLIAKGLLELGAYAKGSDVTVLMETHGDLVRSDDLQRIMQAAEHSNTGLVWDITNMWSVTKEPPVEVYQKLKKYIHHTHIKDGKMVEDAIHYTLLGEGDVPIFTAIDALSNGGYQGYYSFEWEKLWHPEIAEPEIALADYPLVMKKHFG